nr:NAD-dependent DNA ligase LigA [bacterium]
MASSRQEELTRLLNQYAILYYEQDNPAISDAEYDALYDELRALEEQSGQVLPDSPTHRVGGAPLEAFLPHTHLHPLWSLDKAQSIGQVADWLGRLERGLRDAQGRLGRSFAAPTFAIEEKMDGLSICLTYEGGQLVCAATRGNGRVGEDITQQVKTIRTVPLAIAFDGLLEVQGEAYLRKSVLERYNKTAAVP